MRARRVLVVACAAAIVCAPAAEVANAAPIAARDIVATLAKGDGIDLRDVEVAGDIDLRPVGTVNGRLRCIDCRFTGKIDASSVAFQRLVDLRGAHFSGPVDLSNASFRAEAVFADADFDAGARFELATFGGVALFSSTTADMPAQGGACPRTVRGAFTMEASFTNASFASVADFRQRMFAGVASFEGASFRGRADFLLARFADQARFDRASFEGRSSFVAAKFCGEAAFDRAVAQGPLDFRDTAFFASASLAEVTAIDSLRFGVSTVVGKLNLSGLAAGSFEMDLERVDQVGGDGGDSALELIERSARERGDIQAANDARFLLLSRQSERYGAGPKRWFDVLFYRETAGYLVRPLYPMRAFAIVLLMGIAWRAIKRKVASHETAPEAAGAQGRARMDRVRSGAFRVVPALAGEIGFAFRRTSPMPAPNGEDDAIIDHRIAAWLRFMVYRVLLLLLFIALANSNATLRDLLDALRS